METLIIYAHPNKKGHNGFTLSRVLKHLDKKKEGFEVIDLYKSRFNPVLSNEDLNQDILSDTRKFQEKILSTEKLIFIFPLWWDGVPAILKGFFDRVLTSGFAFNYKKLPFSMFGEDAKPVGLLTGKKALILSTSGSQKWTSRLILGNRGYKVVTKDILGFCGIKSKVFQVGGCKRLTDKKKNEITRNVRRGLRWL